MAQKRPASPAPDADSVIDQPQASKKTKENPTPELEFIVHGRPDWDFEREYGDLARVPIEDFNDEQVKYRKAISAVPGCPWIISKRAYDIGCRYQLEMQKRDAEGWGMNVYSDDFGYATKELVENQVQRFSQHYFKKDITETSFRVEALANFLCEVNDVWLNIDDGDCVVALHQLLLRAFLATFHLLHSHCQFVPDGPFKSLRMCVAAVLHWLQITHHDTFFDDPAEAEDAAAVIGAYCEANDWDCGLAYRGKAFVENSDLPEDFSIDDRADDPFQFAKPFKAFLKKYGEGRPKEIGGDAYDITKWSSAERKRCAYDGIDPIKEQIAKWKEAEKDLKETYP